MNLDLNEHQAATLLNALESYLSDLRAEVAATEAKEFRDGLKLQEETLNGIVRQIKAEATKEPHLEPPLETIH